MESIREFSIASEIVYLLKTQNKMIYNFFAFYRKTFYSVSIYCFCTIYPFLVIQQITVGYLDHMSKLNQ